MCCGKEHRWCGFVHPSTVRLCFWGRSLGKRAFWPLFFFHFIFTSGHLALSLFPLRSISADFPLLNISDICTLNFCWLYCWTLSVIKNKGSGSGNTGRYLHLVQALWIFPLRSGLWWTVCGTNQDRPSETEGFHAFEDHSLSFLPVFSHEKWSSPESCKRALGFVCFRLYDDESGKT